MNKSMNQTTLTQAGSERREAKRDETTAGDLGRDQQRSDWSDGSDWSE